MKHLTKAANLEESIVVVEATLEDVLNIPCSVLSPDDFDVVAGDGIKISEIRNEKMDGGDAIDVEKVKKQFSDKVKSNINTNRNNDANKHKTKTVVEDILTGDNPEKMTNIMENKDSKKSDITDKLNDLTNRSNDITCDTKDIKSKSSDVIKQNMKISCNIPMDKSELHGMCNGLQTEVVKNCGNVSKSISGEKTHKVEGENLDNSKEEMDCDVQSKDDVRKKEDEAKVIKDEVDKEEISVTSKVEKVLEERHVVLLEDEAIGSCKSMSDVLSAPILCHNLCKTNQEIAARLQCISNIIRGFSFIPSNSLEICKQRNLMRALSGTLLLRHKHRTRQRNSVIEVEDDMIDTCSDIKLENIENVTAMNDKKQKDTKYYLKSVDFASKKTVTSNLFAPKQTQKNPSTFLKQRSCVFSTTVLNDDYDEGVYNDPWWSDCVYRLHEDSLITLANIAPALDLSVLTDDHAALSVLEACLHWSVCPSSAACDSFSSKPRYLFLEVYAKKKMFTVWK